MPPTPPDRPTLFLKAPNALNSHLGKVHAPDFVGRLDYEGELAVVMKRRAKDVPEEEALDYVLGYTCLNDITARDVQKADGQWARGKNMDGFAPMGPVVTDEVDPEHLTITTRLNGQVVQQGRTEQLITGVRALISFITASMTLEPGDVIATGTPAGVGPMQPGDTVEVEVSGIGSYATPCMRGRRTLRGGLRRFSLSFSWKFAIIDTIFVLGGRTLGLHIRLSQQHGLVGPAHPPYQRRGSSAVHHPARAVPRLCGLATGRSHGQKCRAADPQSHPASGCVGLLMMLVAKVGWAKPVPVDMRYFKHPRQGMALTALAGPAANFLTALAAVGVSSAVFHLALWARRRCSCCASCPTWPCWGWGWGCST